MSIYPPISRKVCYACGWSLVKKMYKEAIASFSEPVSICMICEKPDREISGILYIAKADHICDECKSRLKNYYTEINND